MEATTLLNQGEPYKVCILGAGSLGCVFGALLARAGCAVSLVQRRQTQADAINAQGLTVNDSAATFTVHPRATTQVASVGAVDLVVVLVKSFDTENAMAGIAALLQPSTTVLSLQNGLGHEEVLARYVGAERLLAGKTYVGGQLTAPHVVTAGTLGKRSYIGEPSGCLSERATRIAQLFSAAGLETIACPNIHSVIWDKLLVNVATGAISAITRLPYGELYQMPALEATACAAVAEAMAVARASGVVLSISDPLDAWRTAGKGLPYAFKASMLQSIEKGTVTEIDFINGAVVAQGEKLGIATPVNRALVACVKGIERSLFPLQPVATP